jgi:hypothetical protein
MASCLFRGIKRPVPCVGLRCTLNRTPEPLIEVSESNKGTYLLRRDGLHATLIRAESLVEKALERLRTDPNNMDFTSQVDLS